MVRRLQVPIAKGLVRDRHLLLVKNALSIDAAGLHQASFFISKSSTMDTSEVYLRSAMLIVETQ